MKVKEINTIIALLKASGIDICSLSGFRVVKHFLDSEAPDPNQFVQVDTEKMRLKLVEYLGWVITEWQKRPIGSDTSDLVRELAIVLSKSSLLVYKKKETKYE